MYCDMLDLQTIIFFNIHQMNEKRINQVYKVAIFSAIGGTITEIVNTWLPAITNTINGEVLQWDFNFILSYIITSLFATFLILFIGSFFLLLVSLIYKKLANK